MEKKIVCAGTLTRKTSSLKSNYISYILENLDFSKSFSQLSEVYTKFKERLDEVENPLIKAEFEELAKIGAEADGHKITLNDLCYHFYPRKTLFPNVRDCLRDLKQLLSIWYPFWILNKKNWILDAGTKKRIFSGICMMLEDDNYKPRIKKFLSECLGGDPISDIRTALKSRFPDDGYAQDVVSDSEKKLKNYYNKINSVVKEYFKNGDNPNFDNLKIQVSDLIHKFEKPLLSCDFKKENGIRKYISNLLNQANVNYFSVLKNENEDKTSDLIDSKSFLKVIDGKEQIPDEYLKYDFKNDPEYNPKKKKEKGKENLIKRGWHKVKGWFGGISSETKNK